MKYISKILIIFTLSIFIVGCNNDSDPRFDANLESGWVQFVTGSTLEVIAEPNTTLEVPVEINVPLNQSGLTINYNLVSISGTDPNTVFDNSGILDVPANTAGIAIVGGHPSIIFDLNQVSSITDTMVFDVVLTSSGNLDLGIEGSGRPIIHRISICPSIIKTGNYNGVPTAFGADFTPFTTVITATENPNEFLIDDAWGEFLVAELTGNPGYIGVFPYSGTIIINDDNSIDIVGSSFFTSGGTGNYDPCTNTFTYNLTQELFSNPFTTDVVLVAE